jgi:hypothetical protein
MVSTITVISCLCSPVRESDTFIVAQTRRRISVPEVEHIGATTASDDDYDEVVSALQRKKPRTLKANIPHKATTPKESNKTKAFCKQGFSPLKTLFSFILTQELWSGVRGGRRLPRRHLDAKLLIVIVRNLKGG